MTVENLFDALTHGQYQVVAYYGYDTGTSSNTVLFKIESDSNFNEQIEDALVNIFDSIIEDTREKCGFGRTIDNKEAVKLIVNGDTYFISHYDWRYSFTTSIARRLGKEYLLDTEHDKG